MIRKAPERSDPQPLTNCRLSPPDIQADSIPEVHTQTNAKLCETSQNHD
jgi:hypothetical protein